MEIAYRDSIIKESDKVAKQNKSQETMSTTRFRFQGFFLGRPSETSAMAMANRDRIVKESEKVGNKKRHEKP